MKRFTRTIALVMAMVMALLMLCGFTKTELKNDKVFSPEYLEKVRAENIFDDILSTDYYFPAVKWAYENGVTDGVGDHRFNPSGTCSRAETVTFIWKSCGKPSASSHDNPFKDVKPGDWFYEAVLWAVEQGITTGTSATTFSPTGTCTNAEVITFLYRSQGKPAVSSVRPEYEGEWYAESMSWGGANRMYDGIPVSVLPGAKCPRADIVYFMYKVLA